MAMAMARLVNSSTVSAVRGGPVTAMPISACPPNSSRDDGRRR